MLACSCDLALVLMDARDARRCVRISCTALTDQTLISLEHECAYIFAVTAPPKACAGSLLHARAVLVSIDVELATKRYIVVRGSA